MIFTYHRSGGVEKTDTIIHSLGSKWLSKGEEEKRVGALLTKVISIDSSCSQSQGQSQKECEQKTTHQPHKVLDKCVVVE